MADGPRLGEQPLPQTVAAAAALRRLTGLLLSLERTQPTVDAPEREVGYEFGSRRDGTASTP